jgi:glycosyltransferase involved in cell wall biosynthesis
MKNTVLQVIGQLTKGGAEKQLFLVSTGLQERGWDVQILSMSGGGWWKERLEAAGMTVHDIEAHGSMEWRRVKYARDVIHRVRPQVLHCWLFQGNSYGRLGSVLQRPPVVIASERMLDSGKSRSNLIVDKLLMRMTDRMLSNSQAAVDYMRDTFGYNPDKLSVLYNGIAPPMESPDTTELKERFTKLKLWCEERDTIVIGTVGRMMSQKVPEHFLQTIAALQYEEVPVRGLMAGGGELLESMRNLAIELGIQDRVCFTGELDAVAPALALMDIYLQTSFKEGLSNAIMEAMQMALPCVVSDVGGNRELVEAGVAGSVTPFGDIDAYINTLRPLLKDGERRRRLGQNGSNYIQSNFSIPKMIDNVEQLYNQLLRGRGVQPDE